MNSDNTGFTLAILFRSVAILALPSEAQEEYLRQQGFDLPVDELALAFGDSLVMLPHLQEAGWISEADAEALELIDAQLSCMSGEANAELWTAGALRSRAEWEEVRRLARAFLLLRM